MEGQERGNRWTPRTTEPSIRLLGTCLLISAAMTGASCIRGATVSSTPVTHETRLRPNESSLYEITVSADAPRSNYAGSASVGIKLRRLEGVECGPPTPAVFILDCEDSKGERDRGERDLQEDPAEEDDGYVLDVGVRTDDFPVTYKCDLEVVPDPAFDGSDCRITWSAKGIILAKRSRGVTVSIDVVESE